MLDPNMFVLFDSVGPSRPTYFSGNDEKILGQFLVKMPDFTEISRKIVCFKNKNNAIHSLSTHYFINSTHSQSKYYDLQSFDVNWQHIQTYTGRSQSQAQSRVLTCLHQQTHLTKSN